MTTGAQYVNIKSKRLMGTDDFGERLMGYVRTISEETNQRTYDSSVFLGGATSIVADGNDQIRIDKSVADIVASDGDGHFLDPNWSTWNWFRNVYFQNQITTDYYVALKYCLIPAGIQINPRTGAPEYVAYEDQVGEVDDPNSVTDKTTYIDFVVDDVLESGVDCSGRRVWVYMVNPAAGASTEFIAIEECVVVYSLGQNTISTTGLLGQTTVSTTAADYQVAALGPTVKRYTDLSAVSGYAFIGTVTGVGAGSPPTAFDMSAQRVVPYSWVSALVDGLPQDFVPVTDNTYSLGSAAKKWANIYTTNLITSGDLLPDTDGTQDLGSPSKRWAELYLSSTATVANVNPQTDVSYALGSVSYRWKKLHLSDVSGDGFQGSVTPVTTRTYDLGSASYLWKGLYLSDQAGEGVVGHLVPSAGDTYNLGGTGAQNWKNLYLSVQLYAKKMELDTGAGSGVQNHLVPGANATHSLGNASYAWKSLYLSNAAGDGVQTDLVPGTTAAHSLGALSYVWKKLFLSPVAGDGVQTHLVPGTIATHDLGNDAHTWRNLHLSIAAGDGIQNDLMPGADAAYDLGNSSYQWMDLWIHGTANIDTLDLSVTAGEGVASNLNPIITNTYDLGTAAHYWNTIYCSHLYYKTQSTFDDYDDLALIDAYMPGDVVEKTDKGGEMREVRQGDASTIPWPMLGPPDPDNGGHFIHAPDATMFLLGGIKQMYRLHKHQVAKFEEIIGGLTNRLEQMETSV